MTQETVKQITQGGVTRDVEDEVARQKADSAIQGVIVNGTEVAPDSGTKKVSFNIPSPAQVDNQMSGTSENAVQNKVIKAYVDAVSQRIDTLIGSGNVQGAIDTFNEVVAFLNGINSSDTLAAKLLLKQDALVAGNGIVIGNDGKTVSVDAEVVQPVTADGTFAIRIGNDKYTINLNHTHEEMAKLVVDTAANLPDVSEMERDTIYGEVADGEISVLYVGGVPFYGGGGGTSTPVLCQPADDSTINVGKIASGESSVSKTITVKGKSLTQALTVAITGTGYSVNKQTISAADANVGTTLTITCTNTDDNAAGTLSLASSEVSCDCDLVANVHHLPSGYKKCEYVEVTCDYTDNGPYIRTGILASSELRVVAKIQSGLVTTDDWAKFFGCRNSNTTIRYDCAGNKTKVHTFMLTGSNFTNSYYTPYTDPHTIDLNKYRLIYDGVEYPSENQGSWTSNLEFYIMAVNGGDNGAGKGSFHSKYYYFKIYDGNTLVRYYIPAYQESSGDYGLYDFVNDTFVTTQVYKQYLTGKIMA